MNQIKKSSESGRTMLEMIGVLGIMGVIMYGAISGINYGMSTYKVNQTYNDVQDIIRNVEDLYSWNRNYADLNNMMKAGCDNDIFPISQSCVGTNADACCFNTCQVFNQYSGCITVEGDSSLSNRNFIITYTGIPADACRRLSEMEWTNIIVTGTCDASINILTFRPR